MPLDPLLVPMLEAQNARPRPVLHGPEDAFALRREIEERKAEGDPAAAFIEAPPHVAAVHDETIPVDGPPGEIAVRIYRGEAPGGALVVYHGGGWCLGSLEETDTRCRTIAAAAGVVVVNVDYRLAPEHTFPTPLEDCYRALVWTVEQADRLGFDASRIGVAGESAGANLAAAVALLARDRGGPGLRLQLLEIPGLDLTLSSPSMARYATGHVLEADDVRWCVRTYLGGHDAADPHASPLLAADLSGLPPAFIASAECDPLADDGRRYAQRLTDSGVPVTYREYDGHVHGSHALTALLPTARAWRDEVVAAVREHLTDQGNPDGGRSGAAPASTLRGDARAAELRSR
jgi:acetyl esterase